MLEKSIGLRSEFLLLDHISKVKRNESYIAVATPQNTRYVSANFLLFEGPPQKGDIDLWPNLFREEFKEYPEVKHMKLSWDSSGGRVGELPPFLEQGFELEFYQTLVGESFKRPEPFNAQLEVKEIDLVSMTQEWEQICRDQMIFKPEGLSAEYYERFSKQLMEDYRGLIEKGLCKWFGGFWSGKLVCSTGILWNEEMVAFQRVLVQNEHQNQGFCRALLYGAGEYVQQHLKGRKFVALAEKGSNATKIYEALGLEVVEDLLSLYFYAL